MFTGIVEGTGEVVERSESGDGLRLRIAADWLDDLAVGDSVSVSGACLTAEDLGEGWFEAFLAEETREATYLGELSVGDRVNLERPLPADGRFDGHVVQGHVDGVTTVEAVRSVGDDWRFVFELPRQPGYVVPKGSVALDGISLTVADVDEAAGTFAVAIVPETYERTTLSETGEGDPVHVEYDVLAKYVESLVGED